MTLRWLI